MYSNEEITINCFRRFLLGETDSLNYRPTSPYQIFIGPNGSGKSAIQRVITPYPSSPNDLYNKGEIINKFKVDDLQITTVLKKNDRGASYEFLIGDDNLNEGGTLKRQLELVEEYTGINNLVYQILTDKIRFHELSPQQREKVLTEISKIDLTFAYKKYDGSRKQLRQKTGARDELISDITRLENRLITEEELTSLLARQNEYQASSVKLLKDLDETEKRPLNYTEEEFNRIMTYVKGEIKKLLHRKDKLGGSINASSKEDAQNQLREMEYQLKTVESNIKNYQSEYDNLHDLYNFMETEGDINIDSLKKDHQQTQKKLLEIEKKFPCVLDWEHSPDYIEEYLNKHFADISGIFSSIADSDPSCFELDIEIVNTCRDEIRKLQSLIGHAELKVDNLNHQLNHIRNQEDTECPRCKYRFKANITPAKIKEMEENVDNGTVYVNQKRRELEERQSWLTEWEIYANKRDRILGYISAGARFLEPLINFKDKPSTNIQRIHNFLNQNVRVSIEYWEIKEKQLERERTLARLNAVEPSQLINLKERIGSLTKLIEEAYDESRTLNSRIGILSRRMEEMNSLEEEYATIMNQLNTLIKLGYQDTLSRFDEIRRMIIDDLQSKIGVVNQTIHEQQIHREIMNSNKAKLKKLELEIEGLNETISILSPKTGFIAEQMMGFVTSFIESMNSIIERIWTYSIEILPGKAEGESLSYAFPMVIKERYDDVVEDIKFGSEGQINVINFAFKIAALLQMGLTGIPLLMDEVDRTFQPKHKVRLMNYVRELVEHGVFSQIFVISHHESCFGALPNSQILNLDPEVALRSDSQFVTFYKGVSNGESKK